MAKNMSQELSSPYTPTPLKSAFDGLATYGYNPKPPELARMLLLGFPKSGKTTFLASNPKAMIADWEGGARAVTNPRAYVTDLSYDGWNRWIKLKAALLNDAKTKDRMFDTVVIDSADEMYAHIARSFCQKYGVESVGDKQGTNGWNAIANMFLTEITPLEEAGYGVLYVSQLREKILKKNGEDTVYIEPVLPDSWRRPILYRVEQIISVLSETRTEFPKVTRTVNGKEVTYEDKGNPVTTRKVYLKPAASRESRNEGCRVCIPDRLEIPAADGWQAYANAYAAEVKRVQQALAQGVAA